MKIKLTMKLTKVCVEDFEKVYNRKDLFPSHHYSKRQLPLKGEIGLIKHDAVGDNIERFVVCTEDRDLIAEWNHILNFHLMGDEQEECKTALQ